MMRKALISIVIAVGLSANLFAQGKVTAENFRLATEYSKNARGLSVLVMQGDKIVFEDYQNGHSADEGHTIFSGTKSFSGVMAIAAQQDGLLKLDEKVSDTITEWKSDPRKSKITIRQLLTLTSGIDTGSNGRPPSYADAVKSPVRYDAGTHFQYGPVPFQTFGEIMRRKLLPKKETVYEYLKRRILDPIGLKVSDWQMNDGQPLLPHGASLTAREWAKFGLLLKNGGKWNGKQLFSKDLLRECITGTKANPAYGITFWLNKPGGTGPGGNAIGGANGNAGGTGERAGGRGGLLRERLRERLGGRQNTDDVIGAEGITGKGPKDLYMAAGAGNQRLYIIPSLDLVIVRQGRFAQYDDREFLGLLLGLK